MKTLLISNPKSGAYNKELIEKCVSVLEKRIGKVELACTKCANDAGLIAAASDAELVIAAGGDGLINEVAGGMPGKNALFTALPFGTVNVFCRQFKIPLNPLKAVEQLNVNNNRQIPLGYINSRAFVLMCGFGYDASVVKRVVEKKYSKHKTIAHIKEGIGALGEDYPELSLYLGGRKITGYHIIVSLWENYAGNYTLTKHLYENMLNVFIVPKKGIKPLLGTAFSVGLGKGFPYKPIYTDSLKVVNTQYAQIDGELLNTETLHNYITIKKGALTLAL